ncbi:trans-aconitate 2-methyltransferase [Pseudonocardia benzenivorans]|jgi:trans-aconitate 2-methyltransferase|uniref:Trans-aconitate 2-methyltransferase n=2 Tax=Pseudonocardia TaxID=1847 RepID=F4CYN4_PSEUX|nr:trans-aconitate 2-methyltransferase [Pseudonocardia dioxanivorans]AEA26604.1 Trans-aconitate 2-methyltransferase [Pseudonocardia dioxanivorans CB1190]
MTGTTWDPTLYLTFDDARSRPFFDLVARVRAESPRRVVDLGCGPGHLTEVLVRRWPDAVVEALDSSPDMVAAARERGIDASLTAVESWSPGPDVDVVVTNAVLQWVPTHRELLPRWIDALAPGAWFAMQVPGNFGAPSHVLVRELAAARGITVRDTLAVGEPAEYAELIGRPGVDVDVWETTYLQRLTGEDPVLTWITATALRPVRDALDPAGYDDFRAELAPRLREAYPANADGSTWFPFRRLFAVAHKRS